MITPKQALALSERTDMTLVKTRPGGHGKVLTYLPHEVVTRKLNEIFNYQWSFKVEVVLIGKAASDECIVKGILTIHTEGDVDIVKEQYGSQTILKGMAIGDALKGAGSDALRKCSSLAGIALDLYGEALPVIPHRERRAVVIREDNSEALDKLQEEINYECIEQNADLLEFQTVLGNWVWKKWKVLPGALSVEQCGILTSNIPKIVHYYKQKGR